MLDFVNEILADHPFDLSTFLTLQYVNNISTTPPCHLCIIMHILDSRKIM